MNLLHTEAVILASCLVHSAVCKFFQVFVNPWSNVLYYIYFLFFLDLRKCHHNPQVFIFRLKMRAGMMQNSINRKLRKKKNKKHCVLTFPVVRLWRPNQCLISSSLAAPGLSILLPSTRMGALATCSSVSKLCSKQQHTTNWTLFHKCSRTIHMQQSVVSLHAFFPYSSDNLSSMNTLFNMCFCCCCFLVWKRHVRLTYLLFLFWH